MKRAEFPQWVRDQSWYVEHLNVTNHKWDVSSHLGRPRICPRLCQGFAQYVRHNMWNLSEAMSRARQLRARNPHLAYRLKNHCTGVTIMVAPA